MISKFIKTAAVMLILSSQTYFVQREIFAQSEGQIPSTNWINHPYYRDGKCDTYLNIGSWADRDIDLIKREKNKIDYNPMVESYDFKDAIKDPNKRPNRNDKFEQAYYDVIDFKENMTDGINKRLRGMGMKAKIDLKKVTLRLWEQQATEKRIDLSRPLSIPNAFTKKFEAETKYNRHGVYFTLSAHFDDFRFGLGKQ